MSINYEEQCCTDGQTHMSCGMIPDNHMNAILHYTTLFFDFKRADLPSQDSLQWNTHSEASLV